MRSAVCSAIEIGLLLGAFVSAPAADRVAPVYPGAVHAPEYDSGYAEVWLSRDPPERVAAWYTQKLGPPTRAREGKEWVFVVMSQNETIAALEKGGRHWTMVEDAGVQIQGRIRHGDQCVSDHFSMLRQLIDRGGSQAEYDRLCETHGWIESAFYRLHDPEGDAKPMDVYLYERDKAALTGNAGAGAVDTAAIGQRMQALVMQGRAEEAARLMESLAGAHQASGTLPEDAWARWVAHIESVAEQAFRTVIRIHKDPAVWEERPAGAVP